MTSTAKLFGTIICAALVIIVMVGFAFGGWAGQLSQLSGAGTPSFITPGTNQYTNGLTVYNNINDPVVGALVTANVKEQFFTLSAVPFSATSVDKSIMTGAYSSSAGKWVSTLDAGAYQMLVTDINSGTKAYYPLLQTIVVPGTNTTTDAGQAIVQMQPATISLVERATPSVSSTVKAYDTETLLYSISQSNINMSSAYTRWQVQNVITVGGVQGQVIQSGRFYIPSITGLQYSGATLNGQAVSLTLDTIGTCDGTSGYYITFNDLAAGSTIQLNYNVQKVGSGAAAGSIAMALFEDYGCQAEALRWWTDATSSVTINVDS